ncbi:MAG TPA: alpha/beta fold hydrolase [Methylomirabilota bacterium]|nr:alpha/beta fold hydrolase [Methylomirabilota bacterium]
MPTVRANGLTLHYLEAGAGEPLVLLMGFGGDHTAWGLQVPAFAERYRVIAPDNRGAGQSETPDVPYTTRLMADDTVGLMDALGIERAHLLGVSMGGMIAQEIALHHPGRVRSLQLHCTYARPDRYTLALLEAWRLVRTTVGREEALRTIALWLFAPETYNERPEFVEAVLQAALANPFPQSLTGFLRQGEAVQEHDTLERLGAIRCPTLVAGAEADILVPPRFWRELAARIPGAELHVLSGAGHVYFWERPDVFNALCVNFLGKHAPS